MSRTRVWKLKSTELGSKPYSKSRKIKPFHCQDGIGDQSWQTYFMSISFESQVKYKQTYKDVRRIRRQYREFRQALNQRAKAVLKKQTKELINELE